MLKSCCKKNRSGSGFIVVAATVSKKLLQKTVLMSQYLWFSITEVTVLLCHLPSETIYM